jgi:hypothetical protein
MLSELIGVLFAFVSLAIVLGPSLIITTKLEKSGASFVLTAISGLSVGILMVTFYFELLITLDALLAG